MSKLGGKGNQLNVGGRPRKFNEPSRPITVTLPDRILRQLESVNSDRAIAIAKAADWTTQQDDSSTHPVELVEVEEGRSIILVGPSRCLRKIPWLRLVEIAPARFLLVIPTGTQIETLEVAIMDLLDSLKKGDNYEHELLTQLRKSLTAHRRTKTVSKAELLLIDNSK